MRQQISFMFVGLGLTCSLVSCGSNVQNHPTDTTSNLPTTAESTTESSPKEGSALLEASIDELVTAWKPALTSGDLVSATVITTKLPQKVDSECRPKLKDFQSEALSEYEAKGTEGIAKANAEKGGARAIDFLQYWQSYVQLAGELCG